MPFNEKIDYGLHALVILAQYHNVAVNPEEVKHKFDLDGKGLDLVAWLLAAKSLELKVKRVKKSIERLPFIHLPALIWRDDGQHVILTKIDTQTNRYLIFGIVDKKVGILSNYASIGQKGW